MKAEGKQQNNVNKILMRIKTGQNYTPSSPIRHRERWTGKSEEYQNKTELGSKKVTDADTLLASFRLLLPNHGSFK